MKLATLFCVGVLALGCSDAGANGPVSLKQSCVNDDAGVAYPACPYGIEVGQTAQNATFVGRMGGLDTPRGDISLASLHALRASGSRFLVLNVAAFWCSPCKEEAKEFQASMVPEYSKKGVAFLSVVLQNAARQPTTDDEIDTWIRAFKITFPVVRDPQGYVSKYFDPSTMPLNMVIDLETMKIELKVIGADLPRVKSTLDRLLAG